MAVQHTRVQVGSSGRELPYRRSGGTLWRMVSAVAVFMVAVAALDGGVDAGAVDAGRADAGVVDAGPKLPVEYWQHDGGEEIAEGVTDALAVKVGSTLMVSFNEPVTLRVCDQPLVDIQPAGDSLLFKGLKEGETECGFWFSRKQPVPQRRMRIKVIGPKAMSAPPAAKGTRPWWAPGSDFRPANDEEP